MAKRKEELKTLLKEENNTAALKLSIKKETKIMTSSPITAWLIEGEKVAQGLNPDLLHCRQMLIPSEPPAK